MRRRGDRNSLLTHKHPPASRSESQTIRALTQRYEGPSPPAALPCVLEAVIVGMIPHGPNCGWAMKQDTPGQQEEEAIT